MGEERGGGGRLGEGGSRRWKAGCGGKARKDRRRQGKEGQNGGSRKTKSVVMLCRAPHRASTYVRTDDLTVTLCCVGCEAGTSPGVYLRED